MPGHAGGAKNGDVISWLLSAAGAERKLAQPPIVMSHRVLLLLVVLSFTAMSPAWAKTRELNDYGRLIRPKDEM